MMAINQVIYGGETLMDVRDSTVTENNLMDGAVAYNAAGERIVGELSPVLYTPQELTDAQKAQARENIGAVSDEKLDATKYGLPVLYLTGDVSAMNKDDAVNLAYQYGERSGTASVKWQGSSSLSYPKKNYTIKLDNAFEAVEGWGAQKKYCLKANYIDFSHARNVVSAKLWGQVVKSRAVVDERLTALPNAGAVDGFPICVYINDKYQGLYTFNIPKDGWMLGMGDGENECIMCANHHSDATRFSATALCDESDFEIEYVPDEDNAQWAIDSLNRLISAVMASDGSDMDSVIANYVDIDSAIDFYIFTVLISGSDNADKNYILATYDGVKWFFTMYDMDGTWGLDAGGKKWYSPVDAYPTINLFNHKLVKLLTAYKTDEIKARYAELMNGVLSVSNVYTTFANFITSIPRALYNEELMLWPNIPSSSVNDLHQIIDNYMLRVPKMSEQVDSLEAVDIIPAPQLAARNTWYRGTTATTDITQINIVSSYSETGSETESFNADAVDTGSIKGYVTDGVLTLAPKNGARKICLHGTSTVLFADFKNVVEINGTELLTTADGEAYMQEAFSGLSKLVSKITLPEGVTSMASCFALCSSMTEPPNIPSTVTDLNTAFFNCSALLSAPSIPSGFSGNCNNMMNRCSSVTSLDGFVVPEGVTKMNSMFTNMMNVGDSTVTINAQNLETYSDAFLNTSIVAWKTITLVGTCPLLAEIAATNTHGRVVVGE